MEAYKDQHDDYPKRGSAGDVQYNTCQYNANMSNFCWLAAPVDGTVTILHCVSAIVTLRRLTFRSGYGKRHVGIYIAACDRPHAAALATAAT